MQVESPTNEKAKDFAARVESSLHIAPMSDAHLWSSPDH